MFPIPFWFLTHICQINYKVWVDNLSIPITHLFLTIAIQLVLVIFKKQTVLCRWISVNITAWGASTNSCDFTIFKTHDEFWSSWNVQDWQSQSLKFSIYSQWQCELSHYEVYLEETNLLRESGGSLVSMLILSLIQTQVVWWCSLQCSLLLY